MYIHNYSIIHYFPAIFVFEACLPKDGSTNITDEEIDGFINCSSRKENHLSPKYSIIICLIESLESWPIEGCGQLQSVTPNLNTIVNHDHVAYFSKVKSQVKNGVSGDGQMIVNTGLLPTYSGAACQLYGLNTFPNFAHFYGNSVLINPWPHIWNQDVVTKSYGYLRLIEPKQGKYNDPELFNQLLAEINSPAFKDVKSCIMTMTMSTHLPFDVSSFPQKEFDESVPKMISDYLNCLSYSDSCMKAFLDIVGNGDLENVVVVITGDHTVFKGKSVSDISKIHGVDTCLVSDEQSYCPLILYSPSICGNIKSSEEVYQMDIYPTIMSLIGCDKYFWKGLGINLLDNENRQIDEIDAYNLSDRIIRSNYFSKNCSSCQN